MSETTLADVIAASGKGRKEPLFITDDFSFPLEAFHVPPQYAKFVKSVLLPKGIILDRIQKIAADMHKAYEGIVPHFLVVLKGGNEFANDLTRAIRERHSYGTSELLPFTMDFIRVKSYEGTGSTGNVTINGINLKTIADRHVVLIEDIIDTGLTMSKLVPYLNSQEESQRPASVRVVSLLEKRTHKSCGFKADFVGFSVPDAFVVGYGMDFNETYRDLDHLCIINPEGIAHYEKAFPGLN